AGHIPPTVGQRWSDSRAAARLRLHGCRLATRHSRPRSSATCLRPTWPRWPVESNGWALAFGSGWIREREARRRGRGCVARSGSAAGLALIGGPRIVRLRYRIEPTVRFTNADRAHTG